MEELDGVPPDHLGLLVFRHADEGLLQHLERVRPVRFLVREVRCAEDLVHADQVPQALDADTVLLEAPQDVLADVVRGLLGQGF